MNRFDQLEESWAEKRAQSEKIADDTQVYLDNGGTIEQVDYRRLTVDDLKEGFRKTQLRYRRVFSERIS